MTGDADSVVQSWVQALFLGIESKGDGMEPSFPNSK